MKISLLDDLKKESVQTNLCVALLISLTLFVFGSANLYFTNVTEFSFLFSKIWYYFVALALLLLVGIFIVLQKINDTYTKKIAALFFAIGLLLWIQGNIIVWNYGLLDGQAIPWEDYFWNGIVDVIVWIGILAISILKSDSLYKHIRILCILLIVVQVGGIMATVYAAPDEPSWKYQDSSDTRRDYINFLRTQIPSSLSLIPTSQIFFRRSLTKTKNTRICLTGSPITAIRLVDFPRHILLYPSSFPEYTMITLCQ